MRHAYYILPALLLAACEPAREPTTVDLSLAVSLPTQANERGWTVDVTTLELALDGVRLHEGEPLLSVLHGWLVPVAVAHPGHYTPGEALGEWLGDVTIDALGGPLRIGTAQAFTGHVGSAWVSFGSLASGGAIHLAGTATKDGDVRPFDVRLDASADLSGIPADRQLVARPATARLTIDVARWLVVADFTTTTDDDSDGTFELPAGSQVHNALRRGVADVGAYALDWAKEV